MHWTESFHGNAKRKLLFRSAYRVHQRFVFHPDGCEDAVTCLLVEVPNDGYLTLFSHRPFGPDDEEPYEPVKIFAREPHQALERTLSALEDRYQSVPASHITWVASGELVK